MFLSTAAPLLAVGLAVVVTTMFLLWLLHFPLKNAAIVDIGWAYSLIFLCGTYAWMGNGHATRRMIIFCMVAAWGLRLGTYLLYRLVREGREEGRYVRLRQQWGQAAPWKFLGFFMAQGILNLFLSITFLLACLDLSPVMEANVWLGAAFCLIGISGESLADWQLAKFKAASSNKGSVCNVGLWSLSRHPNYFFEWLTWLGFGMIAVASPYGWAAMIAPFAMLYFMLFVTGIPPTEEQALASKGEAYRLYQQKTSAFVPWFPKNNPDLNSEQALSQP